MKKTRRLSTAGRPKAASMAWKDAIAMVQELPQVAVSTWYGTPRLKVAGKGFARLRTEAEGGLVLVCSLEEKARLLESGAPAYFTTPHYDGYGSIIVDLAHITRGALHELIVTAWRIKTTPQVRAMADRVR
jgi:hypothetical protein